MSFQEVKGKFGWEIQDFYRYLQIRELKIYPKTGINGIIKVIVDSQGNSWIISTFYKALGENRTCPTLYIKNKWEAELNIEISDDVWYKMCMTQSTTTCSPDMKRVWVEESYQKTHLRNAPENAQRCVVWYLFVHDVSFSTCK